MTENNDSLGITAPTGGGSGSLSDDRAPDSDGFASAGTHARQLVTPTGPGDRAAEEAARSFVNPNGPMEHTHARRLDVGNLPGQHLPGVSMGGTREKLK